MPKKAYTEEQIVAVLRQVEAGARVEDICRKVGISQAQAGFQDSRIVKVLA
jgi:putative transposase